MICNLKIVIPELDNAAIRRAPDGRASVYDIIALIGQQKNPQDAWRRLSKQYPEVLGKCEDFKFLGRGQRETPVTDREGAAYIIGLLPGLIGRKYRDAAANLVLRYLSADIKLAAAIVDRNDNSADLEWLEARVRGKITRHRFTGVLKSHGVSGKGYAVCTNKTYIGLFGTTASGLRKRNNLPEKANWRDHATTSELNQLSFTEDLSSKRIKKINSQGNSQCASTCSLVAQKVASFTQEILAM